ncbi:MAG: pyrroloquinoline quinone precursor peptide PqqA [Myxococcota bacterium]
MQWTKPQWVEIPVGMEIGAYRAPEPEDPPVAGPATEAHGQSRSAARPPSRPSHAPR